MSNGTKRWRWRLVYIAGECLLWSVGAAMVGSIIGFVVAEVLIWTGVVR